MEYFAHNYDLKTSFRSFYMPAIVSFFSIQFWVRCDQACSKGGKDEPWQRNLDKALFSSN